jgi:hypothetical protein
VYFDALEAVSTFPTTKEFELGVKDDTETEVEPPDELPVDESAPKAVAPLTS